MITHIYSANPHIQISAPMNVPYIGPVPNAGQVRWNTVSNCMEVYNGASWQGIGGSAHISVSAEFTQIMEWAQAEMQRSERIRKLAEKSPTVADALAEFERAKDKLDIIATLADEGSTR